MYRPTQIQTTQNHLLQQQQQQIKPAETNPQAQGQTLRQGCQFRLLARARRAERAGMAGLDQASWRGQNGFFQNSLTASFWLGSLNASPSLPTLAISGGPDRRTLPIMAGSPRRAGSDLGVEAGALLCLLKLIFLPNKDHKKEGLKKLGYPCFQAADGISQGPTKTGTRLAARRQKLSTEVKSL